MTDVVIIGGGPAGLSAGLYAARGGLSAILFEEMFVGGQAAKTQQIDNYPGFAQGVEGGDLCMRIQEQAMRFGLQLRYDPVQSVALDQKIKQIVTENETIDAKTVIVCTGASPRKLGLAREEELTGAGVSYCATCDGAFFRNQVVAVIGGGNTAISDAIYLSRFVQKVYVIHRRNALRASKVLQDAALGEPKIEFVWDSVPKALLGENVLTGIEIQNVKTGAVQMLAVSGLFVAIGIEPRTHLIQDQLPLAEDGSIVTDMHMRTALAGVFAAGDVRQTPLRQVVTAVADGAVAAEEAILYIAAMDTQKTVAM